MQRYWAALSDEQRLGLSEMEEELEPIGRRVRERRRERVSVDVFGHRLETPCTYF